MPKVLIIPHYHYESEFENFLNEANSTQSDFKFYLLPPEGGSESPLKKPIADYLEILNFLDSQKKQMGLNADDLLIALYDGVITALDHGFVNLFIAGANAEDSYPCTATISLQFISWGILEQKYDYSLQRHALFHLVICALLGAYTKVKAHYQTHGCLLDFNNQLIDFNRKLQMGYYLCSVNQSNCYNTVKAERYGNSIIRLCTVIKNGIDQKKLEVIIKELVMGDKFENVSNSTIVSRSQVDNAFNSSTSEPKKTLAETAAEIQELLKQLEKRNPTATEPEQVAYINIASKPDLKRRAIAALKEAGDTAIDEFILENKYLKVVKAVVKGWLQ
ncbi:pentapeptide repeat-containing protein [Anabaena sp. 90]|jgi:hypothetical protein|uniref:hypothetical protein n=1 Tax=Anabaena sp. 90 TaxID=46234 RepID=UPI00029B6E74|nr:hypothetical protein [Anabaena sp. 90]AFW94869.1 pentapeptide repeat-containing protein [Anabaena sp. 90]